MKSYSAYCTSHKQLAIINRYPFWRWMISTASPNFGPRKHREIINRGFALDNGAYADFINSRPFQKDKFLALLECLGEFADFVVIPDSVGERRETIELARAWIPKLKKYSLAFVAQDGMMGNDVFEFINCIDYVFIGGTTDWKLSMLKHWGEFCRENNLKMHVGRVNSIKRVKLCMDAGAFSFDGSGFARFKRTLVSVSNFIMQDRKQQTLGLS